MIDEIDAVIKMSLPESEGVAAEVVEIQSASKLELGAMPTDGDVSEMARQNVGTAHDRSPNEEFMANGDNRAEQSEDAPERETQEHNSGEEYAVKILNDKQIVRMPHDDKLELLRSIIAKEESGLFGDKPDFVIALKIVVQMVECERNSERGLKMDAASEEEYIEVKDERVEDALKAMRRSMAARNNAEKGRAAQELEKKNSEEEVTLKERTADREDQQSDERPVRSNCVKERASSASSGVRVDYGSEVAKRPSSVGWTPLQRLRKIVREIDSNYRRWTKSDAEDQQSGRPCCCHAGAGS